MDILKPTTFAAALTISVNSYGNDNDIALEYIKKVDIGLYQQLLNIENCRLTKMSIAQCQQKIDKATSKNSETAKTEPPQPQKPTQWWLTSSYEQTDNQQAWRNAAQSTIALNEMYGNIEGLQYDTTFDYYSRYHHWTHSISLGYAKDHVKQSGLLALDQKSQSFDYNSRFDFNKLWFTQLGYLWEKDTSLALEKMHVYYVGAGNHFINTDKLILSGFVAYGNKTEFFSTANSLATGVKEFNYELAYGFQRLRWQLSKALSFSQTFELFYSLDGLADFDDAMISGETNPDCIIKLSNEASYCVVIYENRNRIESTLGLEYAFNQYIALAYELNFTKDSQPLLMDRSHNSTHSLSVRATFN